MGLGNRKIKRKRIEKRNKIGLGFGPKK